MHHLQAQKKGNKGKTMSRLHFNQLIRRKRPCRVETADHLAEAPGRIEIRGKKKWRKEQGKAV